MKHTLFFAAALATVACQPSGETADGESGATWESKIHYDQEVHLDNVRQLHFLVATMPKHISVLTAPC